MCPGGGYGMLVMNTEGHAIAKYFAEHGVAAFALKYRLPDEKRMKDKSIAPAAGCAESDTARAAKSCGLEYRYSTCRHYGLFGRRAPCLYRGYSF